MSEAAREGLSAEERALLSAVYATPDADLPRLVYADWLDDHGRADQAELVRLQCHRRWAIGKGASAPARERQLLSSAHSWPPFRPLRPFVVGFDRGFPTSLILGPTTDAGELNDALQLIPTIKSLLFQGLDDCPGWLRRVEAPRPGLRADFKLSRLGDRGCRDLAAAGWLRRLDGLGLAYNSVGPDGARALADSPALSFDTDLRHLCVAENPLTDIGLHALARGPGVGRLRTLDLSHTRTSDAGLRSLADRPFAGLVQADVSGNAITPDGLAAAGLEVATAAQSSTTAYVDRVRAGRPPAEAVGRRTGR